MDGMLSASREIIVLVLSSKENKNIFIILLIMLCPFIVNIRHPSDFISIFLKIIMTTTKKLMKYDMDLKLK